MDTQVEWRLRETLTGSVDTDSHPLFRDRLEAFGREFEPMPNDADLVYDCQRSNLEQLFAATNRLEDRFHGLQLFSMSLSTALIAYLRFVDPHPYMFIAAASLVLAILTTLWIIVIRIPVDRPVLPDWETWMDSGPLQAVDLDYENAATQRAARICDLVIARHMVLQTVKSRQLLLVSLLLAATLCALGISVVVALSRYAL
jgi:hypothetical protein